jgi:hypothetical protein
MLQALDLPGIGVRFETDLRGMIEKYAALWGESPACRPNSLQTFSPEEQRDNGRETDRLIDSFEQELRLFPDDEIGQAAWRLRLFSALRRLGTRAFRFPERHFDIIFSPEFFAVTRDFARRSRAFNDRMEAASIAQALRNVWVMNTLQMFMGRTPSLSPSIFAYSMLYPYTDNYLDRPGISRKSKEAACKRLGLRLIGTSLAPRDSHEAAVFRLIDMIEAEYPRMEFPEVHESLLAIHAGQVSSLTQQRPECALEEEALLRISIEKGGSSVLADGWLVSGRISRDEADYCFGFGVMLQLLDDLQDLVDDRVAGHKTLFASANSEKYLDDLTSRLWQFLPLVLDGMEFQSESRMELMDLIRRNSIMLLLRGVAENAGFHSPEYVSYMERFSPLGFDYLRSRRRSIDQRYALIWPQLARHRNLRSIFDLMG